MLSPVNEKDLSKVLILVVDDNEINRYVAKKILQQCGFVVELAENGQMAVDLIISNHYDLVLMDIYMPVMNGFEATYIIRAYDGGKFSDLPIIALTASTLEKDLAEIGRSGMSDYILKPFVPEDLKRKIEESLSTPYTQTEV